jgi:hypothetical protein
MTMRKILIGLIAVFYLTCSAGLVVNFHHCMDQLASVSFFEDKDHNDGNCSRCGMDKKEFACCNDQIVSLKIEDTHQPASVIDFPFVLFQKIIYYKEDISNTYSHQSEKIFFKENESPPKSLSNKRYKTLRVFRI